MNQAKQEALLGGLSREHEADVLHSSTAASGSVTGLASLTYRIRLVRVMRPASVVERSAQIGDLCAVACEADVAVGKSAGAVVVCDG